MMSLYKAIRQCHRKAGFVAEKTAKKRAIRIVEEGGPQLYPYWCTNCGKFHLTKNHRAEGRIL